jgi:hypothetical protein
MYGYRKPGPTRNTNIKGNRLISELLTGSKKIEIYVLPDAAHHKIGIFDLNPAASLEDGIISILKPKWNESGKWPTIYSNGRMISAADFSCYPTPNSFF